jgi:hypothetical protein
MAGATLRAGGRRAEVCALHATLRRLSPVRIWEVVDGATDAACPAHAEEIVAVAALAVVGFVAPLAASWAIEMAYRAHFAARQRPGCARGPAALLRPPAARLALAGAAFLGASLCAVSAIMSAADAGFF